MIKVNKLLESVSDLFLVKDNKIHPSLSMITKDRCEMARDWARNNKFPLIDPEAKWNDIDHTYKKYLSIPKFWQHRVDDACIRIFSIPMDELYRRIKSYIENDGVVSDNDTIVKFLNKNDVEDYRMTHGNYDTIGMVMEVCKNKSSLGPIEEARLLMIAESLSTNTPSIDLGINAPYFTPDEIRDYLGEDKVFIEGFDTKEWFEAYDSTFNGTYDDKYFTMGFSRVRLLQKFNMEDKNEATKRKIAVLGWNPEIPYNEETQVKANERIYKIVSERTKNIDLVDLSQMIDNMKIVDESTLITINGLKPIFVVFKRDKNSIVHSIISKATNSFWAHSAISFDVSLKKMYSFQSGGFYSESIYDYPPGTIINVMCCFVNDNIFTKMRKAIVGFRRNKNKTSYNFSNLINCLTRKASENTKSMVCSGFTDFILKIGDISPTKKSFSTIHPGRLKRAITSDRRKRWYNLFKGDYKDYSSNKIKVYLSNVAAEHIGEETVDDMIKNTNKEMDEIFKTMVEPYINMIIINDDTDYDMEIGNQYSINDI